MRGDSLRDLYAKTLALMGLGVLAGAGALVDFWPAGVRLIPVSSALRLPDAADQTPVVPLPAPESGSRQAAQTVARVSVRAVSAVSPDMGDAVEPQGTALDTRPTVFQAAFAETPLMVLADNVMTESWGAAVAITKLDAAETAPDVAETIAPGFEPWATPQPALNRGTPDESPGFLSGAIKKTQSLVRTSARTGASIVDAVRVGLGVVRRALPDARDQSFRPGT